MWSSAPVGSSSWTQSMASLRRGPGAGRSARVEDPLHLSSDPSPSLWTLRFAARIAPPAPQRAHWRATETLRASRRRPRDGGKDRAMTRVQKWGGHLTLGRMILCKHPERLLTKTTFGFFFPIHWCYYFSIASLCDRSFKCYFSPKVDCSPALILLCNTGGKESPCLQMNCPRPRLQARTAHLLPVR